MKKQASWLIVIPAALVLISGLSFAEKPCVEKASIARGRYLAVTGGCNDCHTKGWLATEAKIPEADWLAGDITGWSGPWGTTYAPNLRLFIRNFSEDSWVKFAHALHARPPMPWWSLHTMHDRDLRSIYLLLKSLGPTGVAAPPYEQPGQKPRSPYFLFVPAAQ